MKSLALRGMNKLGNAMTHRQRRFVLDRLGVATLLGNLAGDQFDELRLPNGISLSFSPLLHADISRNGRLEYADHVAHVIEECLGRGDVFYDAGANVGVFAFMAATLVGEKGAVFAFEPEPNNILCFRRSLERAPVRNVELHDIALGGKDGNMAFDRRGGAFSGRLVDSADEIGSDGVCEIQVRSIDSLLAGGMPPPSLIKIGVEGGEGLVLEGAKETLRAHKPAVLCEMHPDNRAGVSRAFAALKDAGYVCRSIDGFTAESTIGATVGVADGAADGAADIVDGPPDKDRAYHVLARAA
jgi:FkbM family methyltransferase